MTRAQTCLGLICLCLSACYAGPRDVNFVANPGFEAHEGGVAAQWEPVGDGYEVAQGEGRDGGACLHFTSDDPESILGAKQVIELDPPVQHPIVVSGWSRCRQVTGIDYCVWLDVHYADGTPLWGQRASFAHSAHDWQHAEFVFDPVKPIASIETFVLFRRMVGEAWVDDVRVALAPFELADVRAAGGLTAPGSVETLALANMPARWRVEVFRDGSVLAARTGEGTSQRVSFAPEQYPALLPPGDVQVRVAATDRRLGERITRVDEVNTMPDAPVEYGLWTASSMERVMPVDLPADEPVTRVHLLAARNEYESAQIVLLPGDEPLRGVRLQMPDLRGPEGATLAASHLQWRQVGYVWIEAQTSRPDVRNYAPTWWPDPLLPVERFDVEPGWAQPVWVTAYVPPDTPPGRYTGAIRVLADNAAPRTVPITVRVGDLELPVAGHARNAFALHRGFLEKIYGRERVAEDRDLRWAYGDYLLQHRINPNDITRTEPPEVEDIAHYSERGLTTYNLINMVRSRGDSPLRVWSPAEDYTDELRREIIESVDPVVEELRERDLLDGAYVYTFDERGEEYYPIMREWFGMVHERWGVPTFTTAKVPQDPEVLADLNVDWLCPHWRLYDLERAEACRAAGHEVWSYTCCGPRYPFSNILADDPLICCRLIGWQMYRQKLDGFLFWGVNVWSRPRNDAPIDLADGPRLDWSITTGGERWPRLHGDGLLLYPLPDGPMGCIRLANIRDGFEDYEYLWALGQRHGVDAVRELCEPVTTSLSSFTLDPRVIAERRDLVLDALTHDR